MQTIFRELEQVWQSLDAEAFEEAVERLHKHDGNVVCVGAGRMGYAVQSLAMRLSHLGYRAFMIGDTSLPRIGHGDIVVVNTSSGETPTVLLLAKIAKKHEACLITFTSDKHSSIARISDLVIQYKQLQSQQLMKSLYEQFTLLLFDYFANELYARSGKLRADVESNHSILE